MTKITTVVMKLPHLVTLVTKIPRGRQYRGGVNIFTNTFACFCSNPSKYLTVILRIRVVYELTADEVYSAATKSSQCSYILLKYSQYSNVNN